MKARGYSRLATEANIYTRHQDNHFVIIAIYVDDIVLVSNSTPHLLQAKAELSSTFEMTDGGCLHYCLGIHVVRDEQTGRIFIHQQKFI